MHGGTPYRVLDSILGAVEPLERPEDFQRLWGDALDNLVEDVVREMRVVESPDGDVAGTHPPPAS